jgi:hypothetical protein
LLPRTKRIRLSCQAGKTPQNRNNRRYGPTAQPLRSAGAPTAARGARALPELGHCPKDFVLSKFNRVENNFSY